MFFGFLWFYCIRDCIYGVILLIGFVFQILSLEVLAVFTWVLDVLELSILHKVMVPSVSSLLLLSRTLP